ncbi:metal ABC transporter permease [Paenibacillus sp. GCM10012307]|uniref:Metal ABC transporter permease n=1 Tax=Paenibacillus roseus TaxID=2798579 RepID=A0A934J2D4_9BACL|nr:metal ABC transporter permease [Paenibacillus roseus]MBJ6360183.1 metal ABC transporter permease [Paenibacillus roseus]
MAMLYYEFMQRAFWAGALIAVVAPILGIYLLLRRQILMADTLSHVSLAGVALGVVLQLNPTISAFVMAIIGAVCIEQLRRSFKTYGEVPVAIIMTSGLALAVVLMSLSQGLNKGFSAYLFGSIVAVHPSELWLMSLVALIAVIYFIVLRRPLYQLTFDEETAQLGGVKVRRLSLSFSVLTGMIVAVAMPIIGVLLVSALIVLPAALAIRITGSFGAAIAVAVVIGFIGIFSGLSLSYSYNTPPGGTIALVLLLLLLTGVAVKRIWQWWSKYKKLRRNSNEQEVMENKHGGIVYPGSDYSRLLKQKQ